ARMPLTSTASLLTISRSFSQSTPPPPPSTLFPSPTPFRSGCPPAPACGRPPPPCRAFSRSAPVAGRGGPGTAGGRAARPAAAARSEEHTSELQSLTNLVCRLLLEKKKHTPAPHLARTVLQQ